MIGVCFSDTVVVLTLYVDPVKGNAHFVFNVDVTLIDSVVDQLAVCVFYVELGSFNVVPPKNGNGLAAEVEFIGKRALEVTLIVVGAFGGNLIDASCGSLGLCCFCCYGILAACFCAGNKGRAKHQNCE